MDTVTQKRYVFLTTEMTLPPGTIAFLYKLRWDVEKFYDQSKNKFGEKKGWGKSEVSKTATRSTLWSPAATESRRDPFNSSDG